MPASTNIPISATTTGYVSAIDAAKKMTASFDRDIAKLLTSFQATSGASQAFQSGIGRNAEALRQATSATRNMVTANNRALQSIGGFGPQLSSLKSAIAGGFAIDRVLAFGQSITSTSGKFEKFESILTNALGSKSGAKDNLNVLTDFAATTPNQLDELTGSFIKFVNRGLIPSKQQLTNFGDLAASQGKGFDQLTEAILDAQSGEFERLKEFGIRASKSGDQVSLSFKGVTQTVKATSEGITGAIEKFGQLTGVAGSMNAVAQTQEGLVSNLGDTYDRLLVALGSAGVGGAYKFALGAASEFLTVVTNLIAASPVEELRNQQSELTGLVGAIALANDNETLRLSLIEKLKQAYPEFLGNLGAESATTDLLARRLEDVNKQYEQKIRIALGQEKIKTATDELTKSIRQQQNALELLAKASGKPVTELEKLDSAQRIALAKQLARSNQVTQFRPSYFGQSAGAPTDFIASTLEGGAATQKRAQAELNKLLGENTVRQSQLTQQTVSGYQAQIKQIQAKIKLHQIEKTEGAAEITRLNEQIRITKGQPAKLESGGAKSAYDTLKADVEAAKSKIQEFVAANGVKAKIPLALQLDLKNKATALKAADDAVKDLVPKTPKATRVTQTASIQTTGDLAILKRYAADLETTIQNLGGKAPQKLLDQLADARSAIESLQALTSKNQNVSITGISEIVSANARSRTAEVVANFIKLKQTMPGLFAKTGINDFITDIDKAKPSLQAVENKIQEVRATIAQLTLNNVKIPPELLESLKQLKKLLADASGAVNSADSQTESGAGNDSKWTKKAQDRINAMKAAGKEVNFTAEELGKQMKDAAMGFANASFSALESIGNALSSGGNPLKAALQSITDMLGNYLIKQGEALALAALFEETAAVAAGPFAPLLAIPTGFQLAAAGVMIAGGAAVKNIGKYAKGGVFRSETPGIFGEYAGAALNPEIATPERLMASTFRKELQDYSRQDRASGYSQIQLPEMEFSTLLRGQDLRVMLRRAGASAESLGQ